MQGEHRDGGKERRKPLNAVHSDGGKERRKPRNCFPSRGRSTYLLYKLPLLYSALYRGGSDMQGEHSDGGKERRSRGTPSLCSPCMSLPPL